MAGGVDYEVLRRQREGILLVSARNAQWANRKGLPNRDTPRRVLRRERRRIFRYDAAERGFFPVLWERITGKGREKK